MYSNTDIKLAMETGNIVIEPFNEGQLGINSYDACLGNVFYEVFWDDKGPYYIGPYVYNDGDKVYIPVSGTLLGMTKESVGTNGRVVAELRSRSSTRRKGITTNCDAGLGDVGYNDIWTMEFTAFISNPLVLEILIQLANVVVVDEILGKKIGKLHQFTEYRPYLIVGETVAQMVFFECKSEPINKYDGQYQVEWPLNMIPKDCRHRVVAPKR